MDGEIGNSPIRSADVVADSANPMSNAVSDLKDAVTGETPVVDAAASASPEDTTSFAERYSDVLGKVNDTLDQVDWS